MCLQPQSAAPSHSKALQDAETYTRQEPVPFIEELKATMRHPSYAPLMYEPGNLDGLEARIIRVVLFE